VLAAGDLRLDPAERRAWRGDVELSLTARELSLLEYLLRREGAVCSKTDIVEHVWDGSFDGDLNIVEVYIGHLRAKIDRPFGRSSIHTVRGAGYRVIADA
jgi:DNA-binding response OmpR family regulator